MSLGKAKASGDGLHADLTHRIIGAAYEVHRSLGHGFLERVYVNALLEEFRLAGLNFTTEAPVDVSYKRATVGQYFADLLVDDKVIREVKAVRQVLPEHEAQLLNYLSATGIEVGLLLNFGARSMQVKRLVFTPMQSKRNNLCKSVARRSPTVGTPTETNFGRRTP